MQLHLQTKVRQNYKAVFNAFDKTLFLKLAPPYPKVDLVRFDGSKPGDVVEIRMRTGFKTFTWSSVITDEQVREHTAFFVDEGQVLPPPLKKWRHKHLVVAAGSGATIHDIIEYSTGYAWLDVMLYPIMLAQFSYRKPIYKRLFR